MNTEHKPQVGETYIRIEWCADCIKCGACDDDCTTNRWTMCRGYLQREEEAEQ